ncbi:hypothetical protein Y032_0018g3539 [Ancylostoma ceylanicum]|uniref:Receptor L-domain domain-containing protein n=1 Tax=Ancylostoma ceylanicum TaxID=53326 RepID=A0A016V4Y6_9BILA|nr:hypothetical protein Y032_0018g3539 [Ancylostoma ceylanicum]
MLVGLGSVILLVTCVNVAVEEKDCKEININSTHGHENDFKDCSYASSLHVVGSNLKSLSAFGKLHVISQEKRAVALTISHNKNLIWERNSLSRLYRVAGNVKSSAIPIIAIYDNPKLCIPHADVVRLKKAAGALATDNTFIQECQCDMEVLLRDATQETSSASGSLCRTLNGDLIIDGSTEESLQNVIIEIRHIHGGISMIGSRWKELRLPSLETVERVDGTAIDIRDNKNLKNLSLPLLRVISVNGTGANITNNPLLQMDHEMKEKLLLLATKGKNARPSEIQSAPCVLKTVKVSDIPPSCTNISGDIVITKDNSDDSMEYLAYVEVLHGCLTIIGTNVQDLSFLRNLKTVHCDKDQPPILIKDNKQLADLELGVSVVRSTHRRPIQIEGNDMLCKEPIERWQNVLKLSAEFSGSKDHVYETTTSSVGAHCGDIRTQEWKDTMVAITVSSCAIVFIASALMINRIASRLNA